MIFLQNKKAPEKEAREMTETDFYEMLQLQLELLNKNLERVFALLLGLMAVLVFFLIIALILWTHYLYTENSKKNKLNHSEKQDIRSSFLKSNLCAENADKKKCEKDNKSNNTMSDNIYDPFFVPASGSKRNTE